MTEDWVEGLHGRKRNVLFTYTLLAIASFRYNEV